MPQDPTDHRLISPSSVFISPSAEYVSDEQGCTCVCVCVCETLEMSMEHCVRMVLKVEERPSSTRLSRWVIFSVSVSSLVCSSVLLSIRAKHLRTHTHTHTHVPSTS